MPRQVVLMDRQVMDRYQFRSPWAAMRSPDPEERDRFMARLRELLTRIPAIERDVIELYFLQGIRQDAVGRILGVTQQAVHQRIRSAFRRLTFLLEQPEVCREQMAEDLAQLLADPRAVDALCAFAELQNQTQTAKRLGIPQQRAHDLLHSSVKRLRAIGTMDAIYYGVYFTHLLSRRHARRAPATTVKH